MRADIPAVVVGGSLNGLGVARSLGRLGVPVYLVETTLRCPGAWSRYCRLVRAPSLEGEALVQTLLDLAGRLARRPVLILTLDPSVLTVSAARERIGAHYHIDLPDPHIVQALADKLAFQEWAERESFPVPRSRALRGEFDLDRLGELTPPVVLKPADKRLVLAEVVERAVRAETTAEARRAAARMLHHAPALIAQEWIEGSDRDLFFTLFCADRGRDAAIFPGRKLVCSPPGVGSTALCVAAPELTGPLCELTRAFIERAAYRGLGSLEFKRDSRTGRMLIVEPTVGRTDWQEEIATLCGVNLPLIAYRLALGQGPSPVSIAPRPPAWRAERRFKMPADVTPRTRVIDGYYRWGDPLPAAYYYGYERFWQRAVRWTRRTFGQSTPAPGTIENSSTIER